MHKTARFRLMDALFLCITLLPIAAGVVLYILTEPLSEGITVSGARIFFTIPMPLQDLPITESQVNSWLVLVSIFGLCLYLTHGVTKIPQSKRQLAAEWIVEKSQSFVNGNMGERFAGFAPFIAAIMALSAFSSLLSLFGLYPPTSDFNIVAGWAVLVFVLITHYKLKGGMGNYLKGFAEPIPVFAPFNVISEVATPISHDVSSLRKYSFRYGYLHAGNGGIAGALFVASFLASRNIWRRTVAANRHSGSAFRLFRPVQRLFAGFYFRHADHAEHFHGLPGRGL